MKTEPGVRHPDKSQGGTVCVRVRKLCCTITYREYPSERVH